MLWCTVASYFIYVFEKSSINSQMLLLLVERTLLCDSQVANEAS